MRVMLAQCVVLLMVCSWNVQAADIPGSCMASFSVKEGQFTSGVTTFSCTAVEARRIELFERINTLPATGNVDGKELATRLGKLEAELKKHEDATDWKGMTKTISGNFMATVGLAACLETVGAGCAFAVVGKAMALYDVIDGAAADAKKKAESMRMRNEIAAVRQKIVASAKPANQLRKQLVAAFIGLCNDVQKYCIKK
jgi:hypothetical protein